MFPCIVGVQTFNLYYYTVPTTSPVVVTYGRKIFGSYQMRELEFANVLQYVLLCRVINFRFLFLSLTALFIVTGPGHFTGPYCVFCQNFLLCIQSRIFFAVVLQNEIVIFIGADSAMKNFYFLLFAYYTTRKNSIKFKDSSKAQ